MSVVIIEAILAFPNYVVSMANTIGAMHNSSLVPSYFPLLTSTTVDAPSDNSAFTLYTPTLSNVIVGEERAYAPAWAVLYKAIKVSSSLSKTGNNSRARYHQNFCVGHTGLLYAPYYYITLWASAILVINKLNPPKRISLWYFAWDITQ